MWEGADLGDGIIALIFGFWFIVSVVHQLPGKYSQWVKDRNVYLLIPGWTFFAPNPGVSNYRFVFRDSFPDGSQSEWEEIDWCEARASHHAIWNPGRLRTKLVVDCINGLIIIVKDLEKREVDFRTHPSTYMVSTPYLGLLNIAVRASRKPEGSVGRQFAVIEQSPSAKEVEKLIVCSPVHDSV